MTEDLGMTVASETGGGFKSAELIGRLVALKPDRARFDEEMETAIGTSFATWCEVLIVNTLGQGDEYEPAGDVPIFWSVVRKQLHEAKPWVVGRVRKADKGRAYRLAAPEAEEMEACRAAIRRYNSNPIPYAGVQGEMLDASGKPILADDEAPF